MTRNKKIGLLIFLGLLVFTFARLGLFLTYYDVFKDYSLWNIAAAFARGLRFDASIFLTITAPFWILLLLPVKSLLYDKIVIWLMFPVYVFAAGFLVIDVIYFGYVSRHMASELFLIGNDAGFIFEMLPSYIPQTVLAIFLILTAAHFWNKLVAVKTIPEKSLKSWGIRFVFWTAVIFLAIRGTVSDKPISTIDAFVSGDSNLGNLALNGFFSSARYVKDKKTASSSDYTFFDLEKAQGIIKSYKSEVCSKPETFQNISKPNIVFILLESWSAYYVDAFSGNGFGLTPNLDRMAGSGIKFMNHYTPERRSITSIQAALTGIPPMAGLPSLGFGLETMAKGNVGNRLSQEGYDTVFIQSSPRRSFYMDSIARSLGFKKYYGMEDTKTVLDYPDKKASKFGWDYETYLLLKKSAEKLKEPFFAFLFTGTTHVPYPQVPKALERFAHSKETEEGFKNALYYADWSLGEFMNSIKNEPWFHNSIFIISADHDLGKFEKVSYPEDYRIPLVIWSPMFEKGASINHITSHIDMAPTILSLAGIQEDESYLGSSVFCKDDASFAVISEWNTAGITSKGEYLRHSFGNILDYSPENMKEEEKKRLAEALLAYYQVGFHKVFSKGPLRRTF